MPLSSLPNELILAIAERLRQCQDVNALCRANRRLFAVLDPYLYQTSIHCSRRAVLSACRLGLEASMRKITQQAQVDRLPLFQAILTAMQSQHEAISLMLVPFLTQDHLDVHDDCVHAPGYTLLSQAAKFGYSAVVRSLLENAKIDLASTPSCWETPLLVAAKRGYGPVVALLLERGAAVDPKDREGCTPLIRAAANGRDETVAVLLANGASVDSKDHSGRTAISHAAQMGHEAVVQNLLDHGASAEAPDDGGRTSLWWAVFASGEDYGSLYPYVAEPPTGVISLLLESGSNPNAVDRSGRTILAVAAEQRRLQAARLLVAHGVDPRSENLLEMGGAIW